MHKIDDWSVDPTKVCPECNGAGICLYTDQNGVVEDICDLCEGTGEIPVDEEE